MEYVGTAYAGFQRQPGKVTVQETLEHALSAVTQEEIRIVGSGRTDAGAHATGQVIAFSTESRLSPEVLCRAVNAHLPEDVAVSSASLAPAGFHPRFDALRRVYRYLIWNAPTRSPFWVNRALQVQTRLDELAMHRAAQELLGEHDFSAFGTPPGESSVRTMYRAECTRSGDLVAIELEANGFMRGMVRAIAGTLVHVGRGKMSAEEVGRALRSGDRSRSGSAAPAAGLYLVRVHYDHTASHG